MKLESQKGFYIVLDREGLKQGTAWKNGRDNCWRVSLIPGNTYKFRSFTSFKEVKTFVEGLDHG